SGWLFFFQAEDGIRDWSVTGVQTCALPICGTPEDTVLRVLTHRNDNLRTGANLKESILAPSNVGVTKFGKLFSRPVDDQIYGQRSEERRVGKECRCRWARYRKRRERWDVRA